MQHNLRLRWEKDIDRWDNRKLNRQKPNSKDAYHLGIRMDQGHRDRVCRDPQTLSFGRKDEEYNDPKVYPRFTLIIIMRKLL